VHEGVGHAQKQEREKAEQRMLHVGVKWFGGSTAYFAEKKSGVLDVAKCGVDPYFFPAEVACRGTLENIYVGCAASVADEVPVLAEHQATHVVLHDGFETEGALSVGCD
jgi:hypothetical protein